MKLKSLAKKSVERGSALAITLLMIVLLTVVILAVTVQTQMERQLSAAHLAEQQARSFTQMGLDSALGRIRATLAPFDDPFGSTSRPTNFWSLSPGRIDLFALKSGAARPQRTGTIPLHSGYPVIDTNNAANLNAPDSYGHRPIWSEARKMEVEWITVARNPMEVTSSNNPIVGRFAFWVDDEGSKINVNTADGSDNYCLSSYGQGTPTAVSLSTFYDLGDAEAPNQTTVKLISAEVRQKPFNSLSEMAARASLTNSTNPVSPRFPATNAFNLTTYSRSPDFNIFNLPRFQLAANNATNWNQLTGATNLSLVDRRVQYFTMGSLYGTGTTSAQSFLRSIYPAPNQLPNTWSNVWPLMPSYDMQPMTSQINRIDHYNLLADSTKMNAAGGNFPLIQDARFAAAVQIANYLIGKDPFGQTIRWPFADDNYLAKYNLRQIDSITLQIFELARSAGDGDSIGNDVVYMLPPTIAPYGILGNQPVMSAMGRYPRLTRVVGKMDFFELPYVLWRTGPGTKDARDMNGDGVIDNSDKVYDGADLRIGFVFSLYVPRHLYEADNFVGEVSINKPNGVTTVVNEPGHALVDYLTWHQLVGQQPFGWSNGGLNETDWSSSMVNPASKWMDTLIYAEADYGAGFVPGNSSGIDFFGTIATAADPDPRAPDMRRVEYDSVGSGTNTISDIKIWATGPSSANDSPLMGRKWTANDDTVPLPGGFANYPLSAPTTVRKTRTLVPLQQPISRIRLKGGMTMRINHGTHLISLAPVDAIRGPLYSNWSTNVIPVAAGADRDAWRAAATNAVVPIFGKNGMELALNQTRFLVAKVRDPLVGQLPGDWTTKIYSTQPTTNQAGNTRVFNVNAWPNTTLSITGWGTGTRGPDGYSGYDYFPEQEWVDMAADTGTMGIIVGQVASTDHTEILHPYLENGVQKMDIVINPQSNLVGNAQRALNISKQRNFPSIGHLQYLRTGAMPDNETAKIGDADYAGMPFRCLNFGPANTQGGIPDWAMLDLFTVPNAIWSKPSSRLAYPVISGAQTNRPELIQLTYGGASTGKINLNGSVLWPWAEAEPDFIRPLPLTAQFNGLRYNQNGKVIREEFVAPAKIGGKAPMNSAGSANIAAGAPRIAVRTSTNSWKVLSAPAAQTLAEAIAGYIRSNGPLAMSGQMCDIPAVNAYGAQIPTTLNGESLLPPNTGFYGPNIPSPDGFNRTRNDIVSQSLGNLTVQGNVFAVWVVGQSIQKSSSSDPNEYQQTKGDKVIAQTRIRFLVERKLDPGVDGIYGNTRPKVGTANPGPSGWDGVIGSPDDVVDADYHPTNPKFVYQVINVWEVR